VEQAVELGVRQWCVLGGGEPLLRREIILPALDSIKKMDAMDFEIITNGSAFSPDLIEGLGDVCQEKYKDDKEQALVQATISVPGDEKTYSEVTGHDMYEKVIENLSLFKTVKEKTGLRHPIVQVNIVVHKRNLEAVEEKLKFFSDLQVEQIALHPLRPYAETKELVEDIAPDLEELKAVIEVASQVKESGVLGKSNLSLDPITSHVPQLEKQSSEGIDPEGMEAEEEEHEMLSYRCFEPWYDLLINPDGQVGRCAAFATRKEPVNVRKERLKEIWFGDYLNQVRENVIQKKPMEGCYPCGLMSNTLILKWEMKKLIEEELNGDFNNLHETEKRVSELLHGE